MTDKIKSANDIFAVVLVGGKGKRLRPLSTNARPKAFLSITKDRKTMFRVTVDRIRKIIPPVRILVSANASHAALIKKDFPGLRNENLLLEPVSRNTAPAIGFAARAIKERHPNAIMVIIPADQYILDEKKYLDAIKRGAAFARDNDSLVLLALRPAFASTGFGYVKVAKSQFKVQGSRFKGKDIYKVKKFVEKPNLETARRFIKDGRFFWNAGAFIFSANSLLRAMAKFAPDIFSLIMQLDGERNGRVYRKFPDISIDYALMERADNIYCVKGGYRWRDVGSFEALRDVLRMESRDFTEKNGKITRIL